MTRIDHRSLILVVGLLALAAFAGVLYLSQASLAAELRFRLADSEKKAQEVWGHNFALRQQIVDLGRLAAVEERAARLGMVDGPATGPYVACTVPKAGLALSRPPTPAPTRASSEPAGGLWELLVSRLGWGARSDELVTARAGRP